jgi:hypothetical protein
MNYPVLAANEQMHCNLLIKKYYQRWKSITASIKFEHDKGVGRHFIW